jgi:hypothetical protein
MCTNPSPLHQPLTLDPCTNQKRFKKGQILMFFDVFSVLFNTYPVNMCTNPSSLHQLLTLDPMDRKISKNIKI